jgi:hypothetical protein
MLKSLLTAALIMANTAIAQAQQLVRGFEVASIKSTSSVDARMMVRLNPGGRWVGRNVPVTLLIQEANLDCVWRFPIPFGPAK